MQTEFERTRLDLAGQGVTVTSWYEPDKQRWRANAPALRHLMAEGEESITGTTRASAIRAASLYLTKLLTTRQAPRR